MIDDVVRCPCAPACGWTMPRYRKSDGEERGDIVGKLRWHVKQQHPERLRGKQKAARASAQRLRDAEQIARQEPAPLPRKCPHCKGTGQEPIPAEMKLLSLGSCKLCAGSGRLS